MKDNRLPTYQDLKLFGFKDYGEWFLDSDNNLRFKTNLTHNVYKVIYAFATIDLVGYIGITTNKLSYRLKKGYGEKVMINIKECLRNNKKVFILYYKPQEIIYPNSDIIIDTLSGLEAPLQKKFKTQWTTMNYGGLKRLIEPFIEQILERIEKFYSPIRK